MGSSRQLYMYNVPCTLGYNDFDFFKEYLKSGPIDRCKIEF